MIKYLFFHVFVDGCLGINSKYSQLAIFKSFYDYECRSILESYAAFVIYCS